MEVPSDDAKYNSLCNYYSDLVDTSRPVIYLVNKQCSSLRGNLGDYKAFYLFYTRDKEKALSFVNGEIALYLEEVYVEVETPFKDTNDTVVCEVHLKRGGDLVIFKVVEVSALKDMGHREASPFDVEGRMYFYTLQLDKDTLYQGYTSFLRDAVFVQEHAAEEFMKASSTGSEYVVSLRRWSIPDCKLEVVDQFHRKTRTLFFYPESLPLRCIKNDYHPVFEFCRADDLEDFIDY